MTEAFSPAIDESAARLRQAGRVQRWIFIGGFLIVAVVLALLWQLAGQMLVNPNTATRDQLLALPAVSPELADRILTLRPFVDEADFAQRVTGLSPKALEEMRSRLDFDGDGQGDCCVH